MSDQDSEFAQLELREMIDERYTDEYPDQGDTRVFGVPLTDIDDPALLRSIVRLLADIGQAPAMNALERDRLRALDSLVDTIEKRLQLKTLLRDGGPVMRCRGLITAFRLEWPSAGEDADSGAPA